MSDRAAVEAAFERFDALAATVDPEEEPYKSKYAAREVLLREVIPSLQQAIISASTDAEDLNDLLCIAQSRLGQNYVQCEENGSAEAPLVSSAEWALRYVCAPSPPSAPPTRRPHGVALLGVCVAAMEACNYLSLLYSGWDNHARALRFLRHSKALFRLAQGAPLAVAEPVALTLARKLDSLYTHTLFYLAQVYGHLGEAETTRRYVESTLSRQLLEQQAHCGASEVAGGGGGAVSLDRFEWVRNAHRLSELYVGKRQWVAAAHCLSAADVVTHQIIGSAEAGIDAAAASDAGRSAAAAAYADPCAAAAWATAADSAPPERLQQLYAETAGSWARLYLSVLRAGRDRDLRLAQAQAASMRRGEEGVPSAADVAADVARIEADAAAAGTKWNDEEEGEGDDESGVEEDGDGVKLQAAEARDPFSTLPAVHLPRPQRRRRRRRRQDGDGAAAAAGDSPTAPRSVGSGADAIDPDGSDHEAAYATSPAGAAPLLFATVTAAAAAGSGSEAAAGGAAPPLLQGPFALFLARNAPAVPPREYSSYGPLAIGPPQSPQNSDAAAPPLRLAAGDTAAPLPPASAVPPSPPLLTGAAPPPTLTAVVASRPLRPPCPGLCLSGLTALPLPTSLRSFEAARAAFRALNVAVARAVAFFVLDGFVSEHVALLGVLSKAYKYLASWEPDKRRAAAMHSRRVEMLAPLLQQLNPSVYMQSHKELALEAASAAQEAHELRSARLEALLQQARVGSGSVSSPVAAAASALKEATKEAAAARASLDAALSLYAHFLRCYSDPRLAAPAPTPNAVASAAASPPVGPRNEAMPPLEGATELDAGSRAAYLAAHFSCARLLSRRQSPTVAEHVADLAAAAQRFRWLAAASAPSGPLLGMRAESDATVDFSQEREMCLEMATLLPAKIEQLQRRETGR